jgi:lysophospholipase L1-like esterase
MPATLEKKPVSQAVRKTASNPAHILGVVFRNIVWTIGTLIVSLLVLELAFRACGVGGEEYLKIEPVLGFTHLENKPIVMRSEGWSYDAANSKGNRDYEIPVEARPGVHRIAFLGDSKTESLQVPLQDNFPKEIQRRLNARAANESDVVSGTSNDGTPRTSSIGASGATRVAANQKYECLNFGMSGYGTSQEVLQFMRDVRQYKPEVTVLVYHVLDNDENTAPVTFETATPRPYFSVTSEGVLKPDWLFLDAWLCSERAVYFRTFDWLRRNSYVLGVISQLDKSLSGQKAYDFYSKRIVMPALEATSNLPFARYKADEATAAQRASLSSEFAKPIPNIGSTAEEKMPDLGPGFMDKEYNVLLQDHRAHFRVTAALLRKLNAVCSENGSRLVIAALPAPTSQIFYFREIQAIEQIAHEEKFDFVNLHEKFPPTAAAENSPLFVGFHFSKKGHDLVADLLTPVIERNLRKGN